jgi:hypothetical protein
MTSRAVPDYEEVAMADDEAKIIIDGTAYPMPNEFRLGELRVFKQLTKTTPSEIAEGGEIDTSDPDVIVFLIWVAMHRTNPKVTVEDVEALTFTEVEFAGGAEEETEAADPVPPQVTGEPSVEPPETNGSDVNDGGNGGAPSDQVTTLAISGTQS